MYGLVNSFYLNSKTPVYMQNAVGLLINMEILPRDGKKIYTTESKNLQCPVNRALSIESIYMSHILDVLQGHLNPILVVDCCISN